MKDRTFSNIHGYENFKRNFLAINQSIPQSRFIDEQYALFKRKSLIRVEEPTPEDTLEQTDADRKKIFLKYLGQTI